MYWWSPVLSREVARVPRPPTPRMRHQGKTLLQVVTDGKVRRGTRWWKHSSCMTRSWQHSRRARSVRTRSSTLSGVCGFNRKANARAEMASTLYSRASRSVTVTKLKNAWEGAPSARSSSASTWRTVAATWPWKYPSAPWAMSTTRYKKRAISSEFTGRTRYAATQSSTFSTTSNLDSTMCSCSNSSVKTSTSISSRPNSKACRRTSCDQ